jgi:hypothetical protein
MEKNLRSIKEYSLAKLNTSLKFVEVIANDIIMAEVDNK